MRLVRRLVAFIITTLGITFAILNADAVSINYYLGTRSIPLSILLLLAFSLGCLVTLIVSGIKLCQLKLINKALRRELNHKK